MNKNEIRAVYSMKTVRIYQAYSSDIVSEVLALGTFGAKFKMNRMTWIKPSFLWMMYRSGWGTKENQENILAIDIQRDKFDFLVKNAVLTTYDEMIYENQEEWKNCISNSDIRCQWDPERDIYGNPLLERSIQIGLKGEILKKYVYEWIDTITDITDYVSMLRKMKNRSQDISKLLPHESVYCFLDEENV